MADKTPSRGRSSQASSGDHVSISAILAAPEIRLTPRPRVRRLLMALIAIAGIVAFCAAIKAKLWPAPMLPFHLAHDYLYLPLKGWLWSAWYPWCLILWVPVAAMVVLGIWSWVTGIEPTRSLQRRLVLVLVDRAPQRLTEEPHQSVHLLTQVSKLTRSLGLSTQFIRLVVRHALEERLDALERANLAGSQCDRATFARAVNLLDARIAMLSQAETLASEEGLKTFFDTAFLMHLDTDFAAALNARLRRFVTPEGSLHADRALAQMTGGARVAQCREPLTAILARIDALAQAGVQRERRQRRGHEEWRAATVQEAFSSAAIAFPRAPDAAWAGVCLTLLTALDRMWLSLAISGRHPELAQKASFWLTRSRLGTIRRLHRDAWPITQSGSGGNDLWGEEADLYLMLEGADLMAGAS